MNIVILGPQGSGKGTQAEKIAEKYNLLHLETGKILRDIAKSDSPLAEEIKNTMLDGKLVSDRILQHVIESALQKASGNGVVFDGTPRDENQYNLIEKLLKQRNEEINKIFVINISESESIKRLGSRRVCEKCGNNYNLLTKPPLQENICECGGNLVQREDDTPQSIKKRLQLYHLRTGLVLDLARKKGLLYEVDGERPINDIFSDIVEEIERMKTWESK